MQRVKKKVKGKRLPKDYDLVISDSFFFGSKGRLLNELETRAQLKNCRLYQGDVRLNHRNKEVLDMRNEKEKHTLIRSKKKCP